MFNNFKQKFTKVKDISFRRRMPRLGKIRLGVKAISKRTGNEYPKEVSYFVCPPEVRKIYGDKPTTLDIMFPINDPEVVFPQAYKHYGSSKGLKCIGNGETAMEIGDDGEFHQRECPCEKLENKECGLRAHLMVILPKVDMGGVYQIDIGSYHSIVDINSGIDWIRSLMKEHLGLDTFALIPLVLRREPRETHHDNKKQIHYTLRLYGNFTAQQLNQLKDDRRILEPEPIALPPVEDINPKLDPDAVIVHDEEDEPETPTPVDQLTYPTPPPPTSGSSNTPLDSQFLQLQAQITKLASDGVIKTKTGTKYIQEALKIKTEQGYEPAIDYLKTQIFAIKEGSSEPKKESKNGKRK